MNLSINPYKLLIFSVSFVLFTPIGTVTHEYGHIAVAKSLGYKTILHYGSMEDSSYLTNNLNEIYNKNKNKILNGIPFKEKEFYEARVKKLKYESLLITMGGPAQTILTGLIGLVIIFFRRKIIYQNRLNILDWMAIFLSLFWLREVFNLVMSISRRILTQSGSYFGGDEAIISRMLELPIGTISIILGVMGILISFYVIFRVIPKKVRLTFIVSGLLGGTAGFILWMNIIGPIVLP